MDNYYVRLAISSLLKSYNNYIEALAYLRQAGMDSDMASYILKDSNRIQKWINRLLFIITLGEPMTNEKETEASDE